MPKTIRLLPACFALMASLLLAMPAARAAETAPAAAQAAPLSDAEAQVKDVEAYLQNLRTMKARFIQTGADGHQVGGTFLLKRPGRMRFDYDAPVTDFIVADGRFIYYYDGQMKETSNAPISKSLADFFLRADLHLSGDVKVTDVSRQGDLLVVSLVQAKDPGAGTLSLGFVDKPQLQLKKWRIVDAQGSITEVELFDAQSGIALDNDAFHYYDPNRRNPHYNR